MDRAVASYIHIADSSVQHRVLACANIGNTLTFYVSSHLLDEDGRANIYIQLLPVRPF